MFGVLHAQHTERCSVTQGHTSCLEQREDLATPPAVPSRSKPALLKATATLTHHQASDTAQQWVNIPDYLESAEIFLTVLRGTNVPLSPTVLQGYLWVDRWS